MENFFIKKGASQPILVMKINSESRFMYENFQKSLENSKITFSMVNVETNNLKIAKKSGGIIPYNDEELVQGEVGYYIYYKFSSKDTNTTGTYKGEFKIEFYGESGNEYTGTFIAPISEELIIVVSDSLF